MTSLTVVVPTHGRAAMLGECLDSIVSQAGGHVAQIVVVSDIPDPDARSQALARDGQNGIAVTYLERLDGSPGVSASRNAGTELAEGGAITFLDDDDLWEPGMAAALAHAFDDQAVDFALTAMQDQGRSRWLTVRPGLDAAAYLDQGAFEFPRGGNIAVRATVWAEGPGFDATLPSGEDVDLVASLLLDGRRYAAINAVAVVQRSHGDVRLSTSAHQQLEASQRLLARYAPVMLRRTRRYYRFKVAHARWRLADSPAEKARAGAVMLFFVTRHQLRRLAAAWRSR
ncbi:glycosyltransferase family A protein [Demequina sp. NBRC 110051]|uniref:glycosyltransferase family A protein n=1 Tax=Demequina sp. NBRC 110051 TaxID=1570340 RepID=UPI0013564208|nr:glycosyltransferase family A protein [Demequina sp. NBRC 110051]